MCSPRRTTRPVDALFSWKSRFKLGRRPLLSPLTGLIGRPATRFQGLAPLATFCRPCGTIAGHRMGFSRVAAKDRSQGRQPLEAKRRECLRSPVRGERRNEHCAAQRWLSAAFEDWPPQDNRGAALHLAFCLFSMRAFIFVVVIVTEQIFSGPGFFLALVEALGRLARGKHALN